MIRHTRNLPFLVSTRLSLRQAFNVTRPLLLTASQFHSRPLTNSTPRHSFSNAAHNHSHQHQHQHQHTQGCSGSHTPPAHFEEKSFMNYFLHLSQHRTGHSKEEHFATFKMLRENITNFQNPNSMAALLHKLQLFNDYIDKPLLQGIFKPN